MATNSEEDGGEVVPSRLYEELKKKYYDYKANAAKRLSDCNQQYEALSDKYTTLKKEVGTLRRLNLRLQEDLFVKMDASPYAQSSKPAFHQLPTCSKLVTSTPLSNKITETPTLSFSPPSHVACSGATRMSTSPNSQKTHQESHAENSDSLEQVCLIYSIC